MKIGIPMLWMAFALTVTGCGNRNCCYEPWERDVVNEQYVHTYGMQVQPNDWVATGKNGQRISTLRNGVMVTQNYRDGFLEGETVYSFPHSEAIEKIEWYSQGDLLKIREHYVSGAPKREAEYHSISSHTLKNWYENGAPKSRELYEENKLIDADYYTMNNQVESRINDGNGTRIIRDEFGQLLALDKFNNGELALSTTYFPNGSPKEFIPYRNGNIDGQKKLFYPGGDPQAVESWTENKREGITTVFHNGEKISEIPYFDGQKNGIEQRFKDGQFLVEEITWKHDRKHGPCYTYLGGENIRVDWYYEGKLVTKSQYDRYLNPQL
jgi:antitoxin component YwqK of YwqJK toxin-antitoxin module